MTERNYKATLSQSQGREGWSVIFRHPVLLDRATGKPGRRVRRGLGTRNEAEARGLILQLNMLLADRIFWSAGARTSALNRFPDIVVDIFYHDMVPELSDPIGIRESMIPLPRSANSPYRQVLLLGATGSGKTTLVRHLIGTDPDTERFPSTSTAKTTVADTEIILASGTYRAVVTFLPRDLVRDHVEECISAAMLAAHHNAGDAEILRRLLNHANERFRLSYLLGGAEEDDDEADDARVHDDDPSPNFDIEPTRALLRTAVEQVRAIAGRHATSLREEMQSPRIEARVFDELFEESLDARLREDEAFQTLADEFMDEIERRFELLMGGKVEKTKQGWPRSWSFDSVDRKTFLKVVSRFSSNYAPYFGTLLTPLVNGIRVKGPFAPAWPGADKQPALALFDIEGLGHTPDSAASLPTAVTRRLDDVDAVLLVDNATQPMQGATMAAMRSLASGGQAEKLIVCFTHFDGVVGDNLPTFRSKKHHVLASGENALTSIGEQLGSFAERVLRKRLESACFFLGGLHQPLSLKTKAEKRTVEQLKELLQAIDGIAARPAPVDCQPVYDRMDLVLSIKQAADDFHSAWRGRLGLPNAKVGVAKEHWSRTRALTRRLAEGWDDEYLNLKPVADLHKELRESIYRFVQNPVEWTGDVPADDAKQQVYDRFSESIGKGLLAIATARLRDEVRRGWQRAFDQSGKGSTFERAKIIATEVFEKAAPSPDVAPSPERNKFLHEVIEAIRKAAEENKITLR